MTQVTMPQLGESVTEGTILHWLKQPGDRVELDESLCEIETEKVNAELPSPFAGVIGQIFVPEGEVAQVGELLCEIQEAGSPAPSPSTTAKAPAAAPPQAQVSDGAGTEVRSREPAPTGAHSPEPRAHFYSPAVLRLAEEHSIDLNTIQGTGIGGRITRKDVEKALAMPPPPKSEQAAAAPPPKIAAEPALATDRRFNVVTLTPTRRKIAENMRRSNLEAPQAWTMVEADVSGMVELRLQERDAFRAQEGVDLTLLPYFVQAACHALRQYPIVNSRWEGDELRQFDDVNIGIAVASDTGLVVPVIHRADELNVRGIAVKIADLATRARSRRLKIEDIEGGTFTVNNTGVFGSIASKPILNVPEVAIVTMERAVRRPMVIERDAIALRWMMNVCLSFDHRAMDGPDAGGFLAALKAALEAYTPSQP